MSRHKRFGMRGFRRPKPKETPAGAPAGFAEPRFEPTRIALLRYDAERVEEREIRSAEELPDPSHENGVTWVQVCGLADTALLEQIGAHVGLHSLLVEDIRDTTHRPKLDEERDHLFLIVKHLRWDAEQRQIGVEQVSLVVGKNLLITFTEKPSALFAPVRERIVSKKGRLREHGADFLAYALLDLIVDNYLVVLSELGEAIETQQAAMIHGELRHDLKAIYALHEEIVFFERALAPLVLVVGALQKDYIGLIDETTRPYIKDVYDHVVHLDDAHDGYKYTIRGMMDLHLSAMSNRLNNVMRVLTVVSTLFIPLTFISSIYGMNFANMPELHWRYGYYAVLGVMGLAALGMLVLFRRRKWF